MMNILMAASESVPFAKTGGLADVIGALPGELVRLGHRATVILPAYRSALNCGRPIQDTGLRLSVQIGSKSVEGSLLQSSLPGEDVPVYLVRQDAYFDRDELYRVGGEDYKDNCERFVFFCRAVLESIRLLELPVDLLHAHDWPTGLLPAYLKTDYAGLPGYDQIASLLTIHNLAYQGQFWHWDMLLTGLDWKFFNWRQMEFYGNLNLLKTGLVFADMLNTVSPRYAQEIQSAPLGCGLEGVLQQRASSLYGIINGVDYSVWNPACDSRLVRQYDASCFLDGKAACKQALQQELGLPTVPNIPLIGFIGRLADQKGLDIITAVMHDWLPTQDVQWVFLGTGEPKYHEQLTRLADRHPGKLGLRLEFSETLAHRIEAGADMFLMPSMFEPCGLNQLYSLKYGAVPVVRATGGLADTVVDATPNALANGDATGFAFQEYSSLALAETLRRALDLFGQRDEWNKVVDAGMRQDWSWQRSAREYVDLYARTLRLARSPVSANN